MKKVYYLLILFLIILFMFSCLNSERNEDISIKTYLISSNLQIESQQKWFSKISFITFAIGDYVTTPINFSGKLLSLGFVSDSAIDSSDDSNLFFAKWILRGVDGTEEHQMTNIGTVFFNLSQGYEVSGGFGHQPSAIGSGIYKSVYIAYIFIDIDFEFDGTVYSVRICSSHREGCTRGDLLMEDTDGIFKWISKSGDPNTLLPVRPTDPVINSELAVEPDPNAPGNESTTTIALTAVHIPNEYLFDVPSFSGTYEIILDFDLKDTIILKDIDPLNYTRRDILEKIYLWTFLGQGAPEYRLRVKPTVVFNGNTPPIAEAGPDQDVSIGSVVELNGGGSSDPDGDPLTYMWSFVSKPDGSVATLSENDFVNPSFTADVSGEYILSLVVNDGTLDSSQDTITITAS